MGDDGWKDMPALMSKETLAALLAAVGQLVADQDKPFATVLHGGEPLMLGARRLDFLGRVSDIIGHYFDDLSTAGNRGYSFGEFILLRASN